MSALEALLRRRKKEGADDHGAGSATLDVTGAVPWRKSGIVYKKNEVYLDAIEKVSALVGSDGGLISGRVNGSIQMKVYLSGMPECKIGLNEKFMMEAESGYQGAASSTMEGRPTSVAQKSCRSQVALDYIKFHSVCVSKKSTWLLSFSSRCALTEPFLPLYYLFLGWVGRS